MKKVVSCLVVMGLFVGGAFSSAQAQEIESAISLNLGAYGSLSGGRLFNDVWLTLDARYGIAVSKSIEISPEIMVMAEDSLEFDGVCFYPGLMINLKQGNFFIGAGAALPVYVFDGKFTVDTVAPRVNLGYRAGQIILTVYVLIWVAEGLDFVGSKYIGATIGYRF